MEDLLAQAVVAAEEAEVFTVSSEGTLIQFEANRLKYLQTKQQTSVALRLIRQGRVGYATTTDIGERRNLVSNAVETAQFGMLAEFQLPASGVYSPVAVFDAGVVSVANEAMIQLGEEMVASVTAYTPGIICEAEVAKGTVSVSIRNSRGGQADYRKSYFSMGIEGSLVNDTDMLFVGEIVSSCHPLSNSGAVAGAVLRQLELAKDRASVPSKSLPVVFTPGGVASALIEPLMAAFNGKTVLKGASPIGTKLGQAVFDRKFRLRDDPTVGYRPSSRPCDDEGVPSQCTTLVEEGVVTGFIYDLQTAAMAHTHSTGNGSRNHGGLPLPAPSAFVIAPGDTDFTEMVQDIKEGLVVEQLMGAGQGNVLGGDFSGNVLLGYKVENGKIVGRVKNTMVSGNIYQALKQVAAIGREAKWVDGFLQTPPIYCPGLSVASKR